MAGRDASLPPPRFRVVLDGSFSMTIADDGGNPSSNPDSDKPQPKVPPKKMLPRHHYHLPHVVVDTIFRPS